jgi:hypothetical protein
MLENVISPMPLSLLLSYIGTAIAMGYYLIGPSLFLAAR